MTFGAEHSRSAGERMPDERAPTWAHGVHVAVASLSNQLAAVPKEQRERANLMSVTLQQRVRSERKMTLEEWADMDEDEPGELVDGRLVEEEVPTILHEAAVSWLIVNLGIWGRASGARVYPSEVKFAVAPRRGRKPDLSVYLEDRTHPKGEDHLARVPPSIMVEVVSRRKRDMRRDRVDKLVEYAAFGVSFYWLLDPRHRTFEIFELGADGRYTVALTASIGAHAIPGCEGLTLDLDDLWRSLDALAR